MTSIYLSRVELTDFRTFGRFTLEIPAAPGLTLLVGTNGLGKSTFFDGIEWCLTGKVRRLDPYVGRLGEEAYLTRRGASPGSHSVSLSFGAGNTVTRSASQAPSEDRVVAMLKDPAWAEIADLGDYLAFTHFLGQAARQRFTSRESSDQWEALKGPSGIDRLEHIRSRLRGTSTTRAFEARAARERLLVERAEADLAAWRVNVGRRDAIKRSLEAIDGVSGEAIAVRLARIWASVTASDGDGSAAGDITAVAARRRIEAARSRLRDRRVEIEGLRSLASRHAASEARADRDDRMTSAAAVALDEAGAFVSACASLARQTERELLEGESALSEAVAAVDRFMGGAMALSEMERLLGERQGLTGEAEAVDERSTALASELEAARSALRVANEADARRTALQTRLATLHSLSEEAAQLPRLREDAVVLREAARAALRDAELARGEAKNIRPRLDRARIDLDRDEAVLAALAERSSRLARALADIAAHVSGHDAACPVCATGFPPGALKLLADEAAKREDAALAARRADHEASLMQVESMTHALADADRRVAEAAAAAAQADAAEEAVGWLVGTIAARIGLGDGIDPVAAIIDIRMAIETELAALDEANPVGASEAGGFLADLQRELSAERERRRELAGELAAIEVALQAPAMALDALGKPSEAELGVELDRWRSAVAERRATSEELRQAHDAALAQAAAARQRFDVAAAEAERLARDVAEARADIAEVARLWAAGGMEGEPTERAIEEHLALADAEGSRLASLAAEVGELAGHEESLRRANELDGIENDMLSVGGFDALVDPGRHERALLERQTQAGEALELTNAARAAVARYADHLQAEAADFSTRFLRPLNGLVNDFNRALLTTPGESIEMNANHAVNRTSFSMAVRRTNILEDAGPQRGLPPQLVLSEGQMAANGVGILCAASTAYQWSSWRALLVDDPLQHNDIIHAAAFTDVMRNLVALKGYQLVMSSHDRAEAEFVSRKFDAAGLPCSVVNLTAPSRDGVRFDAPRHNPAAKAAMQEAMANAS
ncbi:AAA family ATPase [Methylobacterium sp. 285MFTsu5.1]|uniref:AAA family ATPase n=1 Tax=Methylobacterium sp. 285MFTsu5.1 TaxID=1172187 RepID=UPI000377A5D6|nr:AAA family ATPase [Methylobacterium sp. 285MFTsu5.1]